MQYLMNVGLAKFLAAIFVVMTIAFWISSCSGPKINGGPSLPNTPDTTSASKGVSESAVTVGAVSAKVGKSADEIDKHATSIESKTPPAVKTSIDPEIKGIRTETQGLRQDQVELSVVQKKLQDTESQIKAQQLNIDKLADYAKAADTNNLKLKEDIKKLEDENAAEFKRMMAYLGVVCVAGIGICLLVAFVSRSKTAIMVAIGFAITLAISVAVTMYLKQIALVTICVLGVVFLGVMVYLGLELLKNRKAEEELIHTNELTKQYLAPEAREHIFGYGAEPGKVDQIQSKSTQQRVKLVRQYNQKQNIKLAPSIPEYWRHPQQVRSMVDPYRSSEDAYSYGRPSMQRDTII